MARNKGTFPFSANFEVAYEGTLDARSLVSSYADLLKFTPGDYLPNGFPVAVYDENPKLRGLYILTDKTDLANPVSWLKVGGVGADYTDYDFDITGDKDGHNRSFYLTKNFLPSTCKVYLNGIRMTPGPNNDFQELGTNQIIFNFPLDAGDTIIVDYKIIPVNNYQL